MSTPLDREQFDNDLKNLQEAVCIFLDCLKPESRSLSLDRIMSSRFLMITRQSVYFRPRGPIYETLGACLIGLPTPTFVHSSKMDCDGDFTVPYMAFGDEDNQFYAKPFYESKHAQKVYDSVTGIDFIHTTWDTFCDRYGEKTARKYLKQFAKEWMADRLPEEILVREEAATVL